MDIERNTRPLLLSLGKEICKNIVMYFISKRLVNWLSTVTGGALSGKSEVYCFRCNNSRIDISVIFPEDVNIGLFSDSRSLEVIGSIYNKLDFG